MSKVHPTPLVTSLLLFLSYFLDNLNSSSVSHVPPSCPSLANFTPPDFTDQRLSPKCFCDLDSSNQLAISCLSGATIADVRTVAQLLSDAKITEVETLYVSGPIMTGQSMTAETFVNLTAINTLMIENCDGPISLGNNTLKRFSRSLKKLSIVSCQFLDGIPPNGLAGLTSLKELELISTGLNKLTSKSFATYSSLERLDLSSNNIQSIEEFTFVGLYDSLEELSLRKNHLNDSRLYTAIGSLKNLKSLSLGDNEISSVPSGILRRLNRLQNLDLSFNIIDRLSNNSFVGLFNLTRLDLHVNRLSQIGVEVFRDLQDLQELLLGFNQIEKLALAELPNLEYLDLSGNEFITLANFSFKPVGKSLKTLDLSSNLKLRNFELSAFAGLPNLEFLRLSFTNASSFDLYLLTPIQARLTQLYLDGSSVSRFLHAEMFPNLHLQQIFLNSTNIHHLPEEFFLQSHLSQVDLSHNKWNCDLHLSPLVQWLQNLLKNSSVIVNNVDSTRCWLPRIYRKQKLKIGDMTLTMLQLPSESETPGDSDDSESDEFKSNFVFNTNNSSDSSSDFDLNSNVTDVMESNFTYERLSFKDIFKSTDSSPITLTTTIVALVVVGIATIITTIVVVWVTIKFRRTIMTSTSTPAPQNGHNGNSIATTEL